MARKVISIAIAVLAIGGAGAAGYVIGREEAPDGAEALAARETAYAEAYEAAEARASEGARERGLEAGRKEGREAGAAAGARRGRSEGGSEAEAELAAAAEAEAAAAEAAALAEAEERAANCGAPLFADDFCPTDEEIAREGDAERLCGPGTAEGRAEAAELGITC